MIRILQDLCDGCGDCVSSCPFNAISGESEKYINAACKICGLCIKKCPQNAIIDDTKENLRQDELNKKDYSGILVYVEHSEGRILPVTFELIGKAHELAKVNSHKISCIFIGSDEKELTTLLDYGVDKVYAYLHEDLKHFRADVYTNAFYDCIQRSKPTAVLVGATSVGRSLAPRIATRCKTGLTADCTGLTMRPNTDLVQTRPAFGGNIMAQIITTHNRPQFATVRARVMDAPKKSKPFGTIKRIPINEKMLMSDIKLSNISKKQSVIGIENADTLIVAGKAIKRVRDMDMLKELAQLLKGSVGATRPVVEAGLADHTMQIGLSGRSVRPRLIITCGVSGSVQFIAGMKSSEHIFAINTDPKAPIMNIADYAAVGDLYEVIPRLISELKEGGQF